MKSSRWYSSDGQSKTIPLVLEQIVHLEEESVVHLGIDHETGRVERVGEDPVQGEVPGSGLGLVGEEAQHRLRRALLELDFGVSGAHASQVAGECIGQ
jgi:hypothetical protein